MQVRAKQFFRRAGQVDGAEVILVRQEKFDCGVEKLARDLQLRDLDFAHILTFRPVGEHGVLASALRRDRHRPGDGLGYLIARLPGLIAGRELKRDERTIAIAHDVEAVAIAHGHTSPVLPFLLLAMWVRLSSRPKMIPARY
jgi:hypothetical protein